MAPLLGISKTTMLQYVDQFVGANPYLIFQVPAWDGWFCCLGSWGEAYLIKALYELGLHLMFLG